MVHRLQALAGLIAQQGDGKGRRHHRHAPWVGELAGLLDETDVIFIQTPEDGPGLGLEIGAVGVDIDYDVVAERLAHLAHHDDVVHRTLPGLELHRLEAAFGDHAAGLLDHRFGGVAVRDPGQRHRLDRTAAKEPPDRLAHELALEVPKGDVDQRLGRPAALDPPDFGEDMVMRQRIGALEQGREEGVDVISQRPGVLAVLA